jgi:PASTA domain
MSTSPTPPSTNQPPTWPLTPPTRHWDPPGPGHEPSRHWGTNPTPPEPKPKRRGAILLAAAIGVALLVATAGTVANGSTLDTGAAPTPPATPSPDPADPRSDSPQQDPEPEPEPETVEVPTLVGMTLATAKQTLADHGLKATTRYKTTAHYPAGTVISQSHQAAAEVLPDTTISLLVAKTPPPPPPSTAPPPPKTTPAPTCDPSYPDVCLDPAVEDYDCAAGSGNGPGYVEGPIRVRPPDPFELDREGDGWGCENG